MNEVDETLNQKKSAARSSSDFHYFKKMFEMLNLNLELKYKQSENT